MNYNVAQHQLARGRNGQKKLANNTYLHSVDNGIAIKLHSTDVATILPDNTFLLNSGGWRTATTKARINEYTPARICQKKGLWFMLDGSVFFDGIVVDQSGYPLNPVRNDAEELSAKLDKMVGKYIKSFADDAVKNGLKQPSNGDCWGCLMATQEQPHPMGLDHLFSHMEECYYVPSLLFNAIKQKGYINPALIYMMTERDAKEGRTGPITRELRYYFRKLKPQLLAAMKDQP